MLVVESNASQGAQGGPIYTELPRPSSSIDDADCLFEDRVESYGVSSGNRRLGTDVQVWLRPDSVFQRSFHPRL